MTCVSCRHLMGEDLESLNLKELQQLEQQLESSLKHIRSRKVVTILLMFSHGISSSVYYIIMFLLLLQMACYYSFLQLT